MSNTGRFYFTTQGRTFCVEPIDSTMGKQVLWGDLNPATKTLEGSYGNKNVGSVHPSESIITEDNGFTNIDLLPAGVSPISYIEEMVKKGKR